MSTSELKNRGALRFFVTYSGVSLPFNLTGELQAYQIENRNTYFRAYFNESGLMSGFEKIAYDEIELKHEYEYYDNGSLKLASITDIDGENTQLKFERT